MSYTKRCYTARCYTNRYNSFMPENPYVFGSPASGLSFVDREVELDTLTTLLREGRNGVVKSPRRYGKTSLLSLAISTVRERDRGRMGMVSLAGALDVRGVANKLATEVFRGPLGGIRGSTAAFAEMVKSIRFGLSLAMDHDGKPKVNFELARESEEWPEVISDVIRLLARLADGKRPVGLVIDEFQRAHELDPSLPWLFKDLVDNLPGVSLVFAGSRRHLMEQISQGALQRIGTQMSLPPIPLEIMGVFLAERAAAGGKKMQAAVAERIYELTEGIPNDVQQLAFWSFEAATAGEIGADHVEMGLDRLLAIEEDGFSSLVSRLGDVQARVLAALSAGPQPHPHGAAFMRAVGVTGTSSVQKALAALEAKEAIELTPAGAWRISNPFLRHWLYRRD